MSTLDLLEPGSAHDRSDPRSYPGRVYSRRVALLGLVLVGVFAAISAQAGSGSTAAKLGGDWTRFGYDAARSSVGPARTGITAANVRRLRRGRISLGGTADSSAVYLRGVRVAGKVRDVFFLTTSYGKAVAVDASSGRVLWTFTPPGYSSWAGTAQITNSSPLAGPSRRYVYSAAPDGKIHKLALATGREASGWPVTITRLPSREKIGVALNYSRGLVLAATGGYYGDAPPYQGHVVAIDAGSGRIVHVWNSLCSDRHTVIDPSSCPQSDSAIWARSGVVVEPASGRLLVATGNALFDGKRYWGDSVLELSADAGTLLQNWTPRDQSGLNTGDVDLGSTAPALLGDGLAVQSGKDGKMRLLDLTKLNGKGGAGPVTGGELQTISTPSGNGLFSAPAVWRNGGKTWLFVSDFSATAAYVLKGRRLAEVWNVSRGGTSPVVAGGLLYVYDPEGALDVYVPASGKLLASLDAGRGHWSSPIVTDGRIVLPVGDANDHDLQGTLDIWRLPS
jgi:outer membrane protein assembly factor BamB